MYDQAIVDLDMSVGRLVASGRYADAEALLLAARVENQSIEWERHCIAQLASLCSVMGRHQEALAYRRELEAAAPLSALDKYLTAKVLHDLGSRTECRAKVGEALAVETKRGFVFHAGSQLLAEIALRDGDVARAMRHLELSTEIDNLGDLGFPRMHVALDLAVHQVAHETCLKYSWWVRGWMAKWPYRMDDIGLLELQELERQLRESSASPSDP